MKKLFIAIAALALFSYNAKASTKNHKLFIPAVIESTFDESFPDASNPSWSTYDQFMKASFTQNNVSVNAYFTPQGDLVATTKAASFSELPQKAQEHITSKYKDYKVEETIFFIDNDAENESNVFTIPDSEVNYFVSLTNGTKHVILNVRRDGDVGFYEERPN